MAGTYIQILILYFIVFLSCNKDHTINYSNNQILPNAGLEETELWDPPITAIHIDPDNSDDFSKDGSIEHPFSSFNEFEWDDSTIYAIKRGSVIETSAIIINADDVILASYGEGERPIIKSSTEDYAISTKWEGGHNITIRDIEVNAPDALSCIIFRTNSSNVKVINAKLHSSEWGLRALKNIDGLYIYNTEIFNIADDGIFVEDSRNIEIANCYIHKVNQNWKPPSTPQTNAAGDGIQFENCNHWHVHHNIIDRSDTGHKFCFISNNPLQDDGIFEYNYIYGPRFESGAAIYLGNGKDLIIRYNFVIGPTNASIWSHASNLKIHHNIFSNITKPLFVSGSADIYNNLFYDMQAGIEGGIITAKNNIFDLGAPNRVRFKVQNLTESHNLFVHGLHTRYSKAGDPHFIDPNNGNFKLRPQSDCIDSGTYVGIKNDIEGNTIPFGKAPDIGPYEFNK